MEKKKKKWSEDIKSLDKLRRDDLSGKFDTHAPGGFLLCQCFSPPGKIVSFRGRSSSWRFAIKHFVAVICKDETKARRFHGERKRSECECFLGLSTWERRPFMTT